MTHARATILLILCGWLFPLLTGAQLRMPPHIEATELEIAPDKTVTASKGILIRHEGAVIVADRVTVREVGPDIYDALLEGQVRIQKEDQVWTGERMRCTFAGRELVRFVSEDFRSGNPPLFVEGKGLLGDVTNGVYSTTNAFVTSDDIAQPKTKIRAKHIRIVPGERVDASQAVLYLGEVPVFYLPFYSRNLNERANHFNFSPGYRGVYGPFLLTDYTWFMGERLNGKINLDYRLERGVGAGPDVNFDFGRWGEGSVRYYYARDQDPQTNFANAPIYENRQRVHLEYQAEPFTNLNVKSVVRYQSDVGVLHDFFESEYRQNPHPGTFLEVNRSWDNFSLDVLARPRLNDFLETVERLPDVRLTGFRQRIGPLPVYYESESSVGFYRRLFAETNFAPVGLNFEASRADTFHQLVAPQTFFGWLNIAPRVGGRFTYYTETHGPGGIPDEARRVVLNTGAEVSFKASRLWPEAECSAFEIDGVRHILEPSVNYVYVPRPNERPGELPQFDYETASLRMLPIDFPQYNAIDSIDSQNVVRFGLRNRLQTKRDGRVEDFLAWELFADWRLRPGTYTRTVLVGTNLQSFGANQRAYGDLYSDLTLKPRSWLTLQSQTRFDLERDSWRMLLHTLTIQPNNVWSWSLGHFFLRDDREVSPTSLGQGNNLILSSFFLRMNENWGMRLAHHYDARGGRLREQYYTLYRDLRTWTAGVSVGLRDSGNGPRDFAISFTYSLKASPKYGVGGDTGRGYSLLGR